MPRAPKKCNGKTCTKLVHDGGRYCTDCYIPWADKKMTRRSPSSRGVVDRSDTAARRKMRGEVLQQARYRCQLRYTGCRMFATQVDRIDNSRGYTDGNTQAVCEPCHIKKTSDEGHQAQGHQIRRHADE